MKIVKIANRKIIQMKYFTIHLEIKQCIKNKINKIQMRKYTMQMENYSEQMENYTKQIQNIKCRWKIIEFIKSYRLQITNYTIHMKIYTIQMGKIEYCNV